MEDVVGKPILKAFGYNTLALGVLQNHGKKVRGLWFASVGRKTGLMTKSGTSWTM